MILDTILNLFKNESLPKVPMAPVYLQTEYVSGYGTTTLSGKVVSPETAKKVATAFRCGNIISDDIAAMPFQQFRRNGRNTVQVPPDSLIRNKAYLLEVSPNRWMTPFIFKKTAIMWLLYWGDAYIWEPPTTYHELFVLPSNQTKPFFDNEGTLWYQATFPNGKTEFLPEVEVTHLMINSTDGLAGRSVLTYARETIGGQIGAHETRDKISGQGLNPSALLWVNGEVDLAARAKIKSSYIDAISGNGIAVFDNKITKFEGVTMKATDAQFLENIAATDVDIANFFGMPLYKLNQGKQSYESNAQQDIEYLKSTLNPFLIQWEQGARLKWLTRAEQNTDYYRFIREALLQTDAKTRSEYLEKLINSGQMTPNEARQINDMSAYDGGDSHYIPANMAMVGADGSLSSSTGISNPGVQK